MKKIVAALVGFLFLAACNASDGKVVFTENGKIVLTDEDRQTLESARSTMEQLTYLYKQYEPVLNRDDALKGADIDENGIRDDIDEFINALMIAESERGFYQQSARYVQTLFDHDYSFGTEIDTEIALVNSDAFEPLINCMIQLNLDWDDASSTQDMLFALTFNTEQRSRHYAYFNKALDGTVIKLIEPTGDDCE